MSQRYPENFNAVWDKYESSGYKNLSEKEKLIYCIWWLEAEVNNGGFHQFFWNSSGNDTKDTLKFLSVIKAIHTAELLKKASQIAFGSEVPVDQKKRQEILEIDEELKMEKLNLLDDEFYNYQDDIERLVNIYLNI